MVFANVDELLAMGGHGPYVWAAYLVTVAALIALALAPVLAQRRQLREISRRAARDALIAKKSATDSAITDQPE